MIDNEIYDLTQTGDEVQAILNNAQGMPTPQQLSDAFALKANASDVYTKNETYTKTEVNRLVGSPDQNYVTVEDYASLPATGSTDTIYRVANYDGENEQVDVTMYSEYAWNGTSYTLLCVKSQIGEVFDISDYNDATYADLSAALGADGANVPPSIRRGGMSIKFIRSSDDKYVQCRLIADSFTTDITKWERLINHISIDNNNPVTSGGVAKLMPHTSNRTDVVSADLNAGAILSNGSIATSEWSGYVYTGPISLKAGEKIYLKDKNTQSYVGAGAAAISKVLIDGESYQQLVPGDRSAVYSYIAEEDIDVALCFNTGNNCYYTIEKLDGIVGQSGYIYNLIITESFLIVSATYSNNIIISAVVTWSDGTSGSLSITRDDNGFVTQLDAVHGADTYRLTVSRTNGNVTSTNIVKL